MVVEFVAGFMSNSLGLISDASHMLFDCAALAIGLYASYISRLSANSQFNYVRGRFEVLFGFANAVFLVLVDVLIGLESFERILDPQAISTNSLLGVSTGGLVGNVVGLVFFHEEHHHVNGGSGTCSHSRYHSHSHHHHHHHQHQHTHEGEVLSITNVLGFLVSHLMDILMETMNIAVAIMMVFLIAAMMCTGMIPVTVKIMNITNVHSHGNHEHRSCKHDGLPHSRNDVHRNDTSHCQGHEHHKCHRNNQSDHAEVNVHQNSSELKHEHQRLDDSSRSSQNHFSEFHTSNDFHVEKESYNSKDHLNLSLNLDHAHCHSYTEESSVKGKSSSDLQKHLHVDHNMEGIFLHVLADTMVSVGVAISTLLIKYKGWVAADPACSIFISVMILASVIPLLSNSVEILLQRILRAHEQVLKVAINKIMKIRGLCGIQNIHVWSFTNTDIVGSLHLHALAEMDKDSALRTASKLLHEAGIGDLTIQVVCIKA